MEDLEKYTNKSFCNPKELDIGFMFKMAFKINTWKEGKEIKIKASHLVWEFIFVIIPVHMKRTYNFQTRSNEFLKFIGTWQD